MVTQHLPSYRLDLFPRLGWVLSPREVMLHLCCWEVMLAGRWCFICAAGRWCFICAAGRWCFICAAGTGDASSVLLGGDASSVLLGGDASSVLLGLVMLHLCCWEVMLHLCCWEVMLHLCCWRSPSSLILQLNTGPNSSNNHSSCRADDYTKRKTSPRLLCSL